jgi:hypothetical protein
MWWHKTKTRYICSTNSSLGLSCVYANYVVVDHLDDGVFPTLPPAEL